ncbi:MAG: 3,5-nucleoside bisphosphate phosphatase [Candidatus Atribacteria bacterium]|nr:3,5-nucleoside bisphosphate phosphatase [Candidatus Atribacteria bacterium]
MANRRYIADLHLHSVLSPCAERDMLPACIILEALEKGIDIIALTDHNAWQNVPPLLSLGKKFGIWVIPGVEVETQEEVHLLCFFPTLTNLTEFGQFIQQFLPTVPLNQNIWGEEWVVDEEGKIIEKKSNLLTYPLQVSIETVTKKARGCGGLVIPAHVDRKAYSLLQNLGFLPPGLDFKVLEVSSSSRVAFVQKYWSLTGYYFVSSSDAHSLDQIGSVTTQFFISAPTWEELKKALIHYQGRYTVI